MCFFLQILEKILVKTLLVKNKKSSFNSASLADRRNICWGFYFSKISTCSSYQLLLEANYIWLHPKLKLKLYTHWNPNWLKKCMPNCLSYLTVNLFLFCSKIVTQSQLLSTSFKEGNYNSCLFQKWKIFIQYTGILKTGCLAIL